MKECIDAVETLAGKKEDICRVRMFVAVSQHLQCKQISDECRDMKTPEPWESS
jgi:hypothetical protein